MTDFRDFAQVKTGELFVTRHKWFFPYHELTDGQFVYAKLSYKNSFRRYAVIETLQGTWTIKNKGWFNRSLLINKGEEQTIGTLVPDIWKRDVVLKMDDGFEAVFNYKSIFARAFTLTHRLYGDILYIKQVPFGIKKPFTVTFDQAIQQKHGNDMPPLPLLALAGVNLILRQQAHAAAAAAH